MPPFSAQIADDVLAACQANGEDIADALTRALDGAFSCRAPESTAVFRRSEPPASWNGPGLIALCTFGEAGMAAVLPEESGLLPGWYAAPDATGESKLATLSQELSMLLVPDDLLADDFRAARSTNISEAIERGAADDEAALVELAVQTDAGTATLHLVWPLTRLEDIFTEEPTPDSETEKAGESARVTRTVEPPEPSESADASDPFDRLPAYIRSMLQLEVPVQVTLASKKEPVSTIVSLATGSLLSFDKPCDQLLDLEANGRPIAQGEAVKIGDKFGLRITSMVLPEERFRELRRQRG